MQLKPTYLALALLAGFGLALGACSSSSDDPPASTMLDLGDLTYEGEPEPGTMIVIAAGESATMYGITADCPAGGPDCVITITEEGAEYSGGKPTLTAAATEPTDEERQAEIASLVAQINALRAALGMDPISIEDLEASVADLTAQVATLTAQVAAAEEAERLAAEEEAEEERKAMAATAAKLYAGINAPEGDGTGADHFHADYNDADTGIEVTFGDGTNPGTAIPLSEDKKTMVADNHGWAGKRYADVPGGPSVEAIVYSNVEAPKPGDKFGQIGVTTAAEGYEYGLTAQGLLSETDTEGTASRIASPSFDHSAGAKSFELGTNREYVSISGTYHGVSGEYRCTPDGTSTCAAQVAATGFNLGGLTDADPPVFGDGNAAWTFKPSNPEARVTDAKDNAYASYGWWLSKAANNGPFTASTFHDFKGAAGTVEIADLIAGTAKYVGGAAGKYALASSTGGTNDAGHFTATATLEAEFGATAADNSITGTIDNFMGADDQPRDWTVELNETTVGNDGVIAALTTDATVWTIGEAEADASGEWSGNLREEGTDGVPKVATGTFYSEFGRDGKMVGAFGANKE